MKKFLFMFQVVLAYSMAFVSCINDDESEDKIDKVEIYISPYTSFSGVILSPFVIEGMTVKANNNSNYQFMGFQEIEGFNFNRGNEYKLSVQRTTLADPPQDASCYRYKLIKIESEISKGEKSDATLYISSETEPFKIIDDANIQPSPGMKYKENESDEWRVGPFNRVSGFVYEPGYNYVLSVEKIVLPETKESLYQHIQYTLKSIISKQKAN